jgi:hypothetical protein
MQSGPTLDCHVNLGATSCFNVDTSLFIISLQQILYLKSYVTRIPNVRGGCSP